ncbi:hypothetical protein BU24DRAFT_468404 [Aaosphaeria arxii CBS 175.79]|uniref:DUF7779 domain-containing protein n=1 Tax=Aaosphaeria arxii CBS 175.79 TaxID=1450172 RepID=A0A6A5X7T6_9PLEO|nr:uncharacterized protein BU24DRAFT_468404 [Aaosphaeria arxii CBS 175.79]KAF2009002.1 hypothetical protein BU24DRAFT_468404 [Aaosphaeria arxii CBS 175.79]
MDTQQLDQSPDDQRESATDSSSDALSTSFRSLDPWGLAVMGVLSFLDSDNITQPLLELSIILEYPWKLKICPSLFHFADVMEDLCDVSLVKFDSTSRTFSLDIEVQKAFRSFMTPEQRQIGFNKAVGLIHYAFPRRDDNLLAADLYQSWDQCAELLCHVICLKNCFREEMERNPEFRALQIYCDLNNSCQRQVDNLHSVDDLEDLIAVNSMALDTLPPEQQSIGLQGSLTSHRGQLNLRIGKTEEGVRWLRKSYEIRSQDDPFKPLESAWAADNLAAGLGSMGEFSEALEWCKIARDHYMDGTGQTIDSDPALMITTAIILFRSGKPKESRQMLNAALEQIEVARPYDWYRASEIHSQLSLLDRLDRRFASAEEHIMEAQNLYMKADGMRNHPLNAVNMYRLGCIALDQGEVQEAIKHLSDALSITRPQRHIMTAEHARVSFKLSQALAQDPRRESEARSMRDQAERLLRERAPEAGAADWESTYDSLIVLDWR